MIAAMRYSWDRRIARAETLASDTPEARALLTTYARLLELQRQGYQALTSSTLRGRFDDDMSAIRAATVPILRSVVIIAPPRAAGAARRLVEGGDAAIDTMLRAGWFAPSCGFVERLALQPYAERLADCDITPAERAVTRASSSSCPFCGRLPQLSILHADSTADGGGRALQCAMCATTWPLRRLLCANCGEEDEKKLAYYSASGLDYLRIDVCEACRYYIKTVDLTRLGIAVPVVDEVAGGLLDVWAAERGYRKIELNLLGM